MDDLIRIFDENGINKSPSIFDTNKLTWFNAEYIRRLTPEAYAEMAKPWLSQVLDPQFVKVFEAEEEVVVVTNRDNPLAARESVRLAELVDHPFILMNRTNAYRDLFDTELARQGLEIRPFLELEDDVLALRLLYENPAYMTVLPLYTVKKSIHEKSLAAVRVEDCKMSQFRQVIYHKNKVLTPQIQGMLDTIVEVAKRPF